MRQNDILSRLQSRFIGSIFALLALLVAGSAGAAINRPVIITTAHAGICGTNNDNQLVTLIDASAAEDCDSTGGGTTTAACICDSGTLRATGATGAPSSDSITEAMLKAVNSSTDEYCLTKEDTTGDFEWQVCNPVTVSTLQAYTPQTATCTDSGDGSASTLTLTPTANVVEITNSDADGCTVTMGETSMVSGTVVRIVVVSNAGGSVAFADTSGVSETTGAISLAIYDTLTFLYTTTRWVELGTSNN